MPVGGRLMQRQRVFLVPVANAKGQDLLDQPLDLCPHLPLGVFEHCRLIQFVYSSEALHYRLEERRN